MHEHQWKFTTGTGYICVVCGSLLEGSMNLDEWKEELKANTPVVEETTGESDLGESQIISDLKDAIELLRTARTFLEYLGNTSLIRTTSKRERSIMAKLSARILDFVTEIEEGLEEVA